MAEIAKIPPQSASMVMDFLFTYPRARIIPKLLHSEYKKMHHMEGRVEKGNRRHMVKREEKNGLSLKIKYRRSSLVQRSHPHPDGQHRDIES